jgi:hypothetical protein
MERKGKRRLRVVSEVARKKFAQHLDEELVRRTSAGESYCCPASVNDHVLVFVYYEGNKIEKSRHELHAFPYSADFEFTGFNGRLPYMTEERKKPTPLLAFLGPMFAKASAIAMMIPDHDGDDMCADRSSVVVIDKPALKTPILVDYQNTRDFDCRRFDALFIVYHAGEYKGAEMGCVIEDREKEAVDKAILDHAKKFYASKRVPVLVWSNDKVFEEKKEIVVINDIMVMDLEERFQTKEGQLIPFVNSDPVFPFRNAAGERMTPGEISALLDSLLPSRE